MSHGHYDLPSGSTHPRKPVFQAILGIKIVESYLAALLAHLLANRPVCKGSAVPAEHQIMHQLVEAGECGLGEVALGDKESGCHQITDQGVPVEVT